MIFGDTVLASRVFGPDGAKGNSGSEFPAISDDGRYVAFTSFATNFPEDDDSERDIFVHGLVTQSTLLVSRSAIGPLYEDGNDDSYSASASADGSRIAFHSASTNLHTEDLDAIEDTFVNVLNVPPTAAVVPGGVCGTTTGTMNLAVGDGNVGAAAVVLSATSDDQGVLPDSGITFSGSGANRTITAAPTGSGIAVVTITATTSEPALSTTEVTVIAGGGSMSAGPNPTMFFGGSGADEVLGSPFIDLICAQGGFDTEISGRQGDDTIDGGTGNDVLDGSDGFDIIRGGDGNDTLIGNGGNDTLEGGIGNDALFGAQNDDKLTGGTGADRFSGGTGTDTQTDFNPSQGDTSDGTVP